ncbi:hypothetical protein NEHOM01_1162 [Nematocida homosporus]|uniref:uncharacterized protein n=1 Tax=Nematocida homosporus TaxID=1912981 RepID=UPI002220F260|nr:uncharacterized protein NEHOM01_1162 [Nematocida homosporus]KAI5185939.1 hypothetical protein NEHOM01_1162 [Nematocida homosporus]
MTRVRFVVPFPTPCLNCAMTTPQGKKIYAKKSSTTTQGVTIYSFSFKCPGCQHSLVIETDPFNGVYKQV